MDFFPPLPKILNRQPSTCNLIKCASCDKLCHDRKYHRRHHRTVIWAGQNPVAEAILAKGVQYDVLQNVYQQTKQQDESSAALDVPLKDRRYCYDCFQVLDTFFEDLMRLYDDKIGKKMDEYEKSNPETSDLLQEGGLPWHNVHDVILPYWYGCFKTLDTFFGTDICKFWQSVVEAGPWHSVPHVMFGSFARQKPDLPLRLKSLAAATFFCAVCNIGFKFQKEFSEHNEDKHKETQPSSGSIGKQEHTQEDIETSTGYLPEAPIKHKHKASVTLEASSEATWYCTVCVELFFTQDRINDHNKREHGGQSTFVANRARSSFTCITCNRKFNSQHDLYDHTSDGQHMPPPPPVVFDKHIKQDRIAYREAIRQEYKARTMSEAFIEQEPESTMAPENPKLPQDPKSRFYCDYTCGPCNKGFKSRNEMELHDYYLHGISPGTAEHLALAAQSSTMPAFSCSSCKETFMGRHDLEHHSVSKHGVKAVFTRLYAFFCTVCSTTWKNKKQLAKHILEVHSAMLENNPHVCRCGIKFRDQITLQRHQKIYHPSYCFENIKQEPVDDPINKPYSESSSERQSGTESDLDDESEDDSEDESESESDLDMEDDVEQDSEDGISEPDEDVDDTIWSWPEYSGKFGDVSCLFRDFGCKMTFYTASKMIAHHENHDCVRDMPWDFEHEIFKDPEIGKRSRKLHKGDLYKCPNCKQKDVGKFWSLSELVQHAESNACDLMVRTGPLGEILRKLIEYSKGC